MFLSLREADPELRGLFGGAMEWLRGQGVDTSTLDADARANLTRPPVPVDPSALVAAVMGDNE